MISRDHFNPDSLGFCLLAGVLGALRFSWAPSCLLSPPWGWSMKGSLGQAPKAFPPPHIHVGAFWLLGTRTDFSKALDTVSCDIFMGRQGNVG